MLVEVKKGEVKPPRNAKPGEIFGAEDLRRAGAPKPVVKPPVPIAKRAAPKRPVKAAPKSAQPPKAPPLAPSPAPPAAPAVVAPVVQSPTAAAEETERELMAFVDSLGDDD